VKKTVLKAKVSLLQTPGRNCWLHAKAANNGRHRIANDTYVHLVAGHRQDFPTLLMKRLLKA
jgi:hypothetical protein